MTRTLAALLLWMGIGSAAAGGNVGDVLPALELKDASDQPHVLEESVRRIYLSVDRRGGGLLKDALGKDGAAVLAAQRAITIAEISDAPGFVKKMIRSGLAERSYTTWVDVSGVTRPLLPRRTDQVTIVELEQRRIKAVRFAGEVEALKKELLTP